MIAPWNFPLAILTGMTAAALVTGNTVIMKPAEQSSIVGYKLMEILQNVGIPDGVVNYLPGVGEEVGPELVGSPDVNLIAFTGSRSVGLAINHEASRPDDRQEFVKHVIAEMGGKNAIIIDDDADLDEAVLGVTYSAFGYAGQKCSACSRCIVLESVYNAFVEKLAQATLSLKVGPAELPDMTIGPVIDEESFKRINEYIKLGKESFPLLAAGSVKTPASEGYYIGPHVVWRRRSGIAAGARGDLRPRACRHQSEGPGRGLRRGERFRLRAHRRNVQPQPSQPQAGPAGVAGGQCLLKPRHHWSPRRTPTVRWIQTVGHRHKSGRPRLPAAVRDSN